MAEQEQGNIRQQYNNATTGINMDNVPSQIPKGKLSYALNASIESFDANSVAYQNESGNEWSLSFPEGYVLIGTHFIQERSKHIFFITNPTTGGSEIGYMDNNDDIYHTLVSAECLNFSVHHPIHKVVHKISNCSTEIYWTDGYNSRRYLDIDNIPYTLKYGSDLCGPQYTTDLDCNKIKVQPNFTIPSITIKDVISGGNLKAGTYQFAVQYSDASSNGLTSYYSVTNPTPIADIQMVTQNFDYPVGKSISIELTNLDTSGQYQYVNIAVIKTINAITSVELIGTYFIEQSTLQATYTGQNLENIRLSMDDIFEKFPYYEIADDLTTSEDILIWKGLTSIDRINYQSIANKISLQWETWRIPATENYADEINAANLRGYTRDEVYPLEICFLLDNGKETDGFHIPGRKRNYRENQYADIPDTNEDFIGTPDYYSGGVGYSPYWKIYNTASVTGFSPGYSTEDTYKGAYQYGEFAYWESSEEYPCNQEIWGELAGQKIRHHKFPDVLVSPIFESKVFTNQDSLQMGSEAIYPIGIKVDPNEIRALINSSSLTTEQKNSIVGFKILRGDRSTNKSIVAKGILRNVGKYNRDNKDYYFPNYPYNDLGADPFISGTNNAYAQICLSYDVVVSALGIDGTAKIEYTDCNTNLTTNINYTSTGTYQLCSISKPIVINDATVKSGVSTYEVWYASKNCALCRGYRVAYYDRFDGYVEKWVSGAPFNSTTLVMEVTPDTGGVVRVEGPGEANIEYKYTVTGEEDCGNSQSLPVIRDTEELSYRMVFNSPETSFGQPFLGNSVKLESVIYGAGKAHFTEVKNNAKYKLLTKEAQEDALKASQKIGDISSDFDASAMFAAYQSYLQIYINGITRKNYAYSFNSIASYDYNVGIPNGLGVKQRNLDIIKYLIPGVVSTGDDIPINNYQRESSVYLKTNEDKTSLPYPDRSPNMLSGNISKVTDYSRFTVSTVGNCDSPGKDEDIRSVVYYASIKNDFINQWGQVYSYETIDTGYQYIFDSSINTTVFGGDTFISRFAFKTKLPFFTDNRVGAPDDSDIFYDEIGNVGYPKYWHSARSILASYNPEDTDGDDELDFLLTNIISYKAHNFDCPNSQYVEDGQDSSTNPGRTFYDGYFYLFAYGVPYFYCESSYNTDLRQAFNNREGDFFPHVSTHIPDDWLQESFVSIANDNTYYYNVTFSKQNKENYFSHLPFDWEDKLCYTNYPFRAIYSDAQIVDANNDINSWLIYRATSYHDFPQNFGNLISLDGIQNKAILARFENKTLLYNNLLTIDTSNPQAAYVGNPRMFENPPIDFAETDLGYSGSQHKMLLKIPQGQINVDAKRGQVFLISGTNSVDLSGFGSGLNRFFTDHLAFEILRYFPNAKIDNNFNGIGLHGVYDSKYDRVILTKLDYVPIDDRIKYDEDLDEFYIEEIIEMEVFHCDLWGTAVQIDNCELAGEAQEIIR